MHLHQHSRSRRLAPLVAAAFVVVALIGCSAPAGGSSSTPSADDHGHVDEAEEVSEAQLHLISGGSEGPLALLDLVTEEELALVESADAPVVDVSSDGRFVFRTDRSGDTTTVQVVDSGVWTVEHGDHFHYYRAEPRAIGSVSGTGPATVHTADRRTAVTFAETGEVIVLAHDDLEAGLIGDPERVAITPHVGAIAFPFGGALLVTAPDDAGAPSAVEAITAGGTAPIASVPCAQTSSATLTRVGAVFTCADGAVIGTGADGDITWQAIRYPAATSAPPATSLAGRTGRPSVAGIAGDAGAWRLDSRTREWAFLPSETALLAVSAVSDDANLTVAVDTAGRILVLDAAGTTLAMTEAVLAASVGDRESRSHVRVIVDAQRAYVSDPAQNRILEIDYRDNARIARTFPVADATFFEQVG